MNQGCITPQIQVTLDCNFACSYCFQEHKKGVIELSTVEAILQKVIEYNSQSPMFNGQNTFQVYWHGGEPLLAGIDFFQNIVQMEKKFPKLTFNHRIQTNGSLMTRTLAEFFTEHKFSMGFSLDGPEDVHNKNRRFNKSKKATFADTMRGIECYQNIAQLDQIPVIAVITKSSLGQATAIYDFFKELGARVQLDIYDIRCLDLLTDNHNGKAIFNLAPSQKEIGEFLISLFDLWFYDQSQKVDFHELRNEVKMVLQADEKRGMPFHKKRCDPGRVIFSPNGLVFSCDQYINDEKTALGNILEDELPVMIAKKEAQWESIKKHIRKCEAHMGCSSCDWKYQCSGGCASCMKYNALLQSARVNSLPDSRWFEAPPNHALDAIIGETYYCDGFRLLRKHIQHSVQKELKHVQ